MTVRRRQLLWELINDQLDGIESGEDAEYVCEQWWAEIADVDGNGWLW